MRYESRYTQGDWQLLELVDEQGRRPCSDEYADASDEDLAHVLHQLRLLKAAGQPPDPGRGRPRSETVSHRCKGAKVEIRITVLKPKPSPYRLYFIVLDQSRRQLLFLYAVTKKKWKRDAKDFDACCTRLAAYRGGEKYRAEPIDLPD